MIDQRHKFDNEQIFFYNNKLHASMSQTDQIFLKFTHCLLYLIEVFSRLDDSRTAIIAPLYIARCQFNCEACVFSFEYNNFMPKIRILCKSKCPLFYRNCPLSFLLSFVFQSSHAHGLPRCTPHRQFLSLCYKNT